jgi:hypothetical protein
MNSAPLVVRIRCRACGFVQDYSLTEMVSQLRAAGLLKATSDSSPDVIRALYIASAAKLPCPDCEFIGITASDAPADDDEAWGQARACELCRQPIPTERLELLPDTRLCAACQAKDERGEASDHEREFCPRCGTVMQVTQSRGPGISRYALRCPACRRSR